MFIWFKSIQSVAAKWQCRIKGERVLLLEAFFLLGIARSAVFLLPFRWLAVSLGKKISRDERKDISADDLSLAMIIGKAICSAANYTPWKSVCLPQAVAAKWMLKRRGIASILYLGVAKLASDPDKLAAHAWLCCGGVIITGSADNEGYTVVSMFF